MPVYCRITSNSLISSFFSSSNAAAAAFSASNSAFFFSEALFGERGGELFVLGGGLFCFCLFGIELLKPNLGSGFFFD